MRKAITLVFLLCSALPVFAQRDDSRFLLPNRQAISVIQYGANGQDTLDDAAAIQAALNAAGSAATNGIPASVYLPAGTYYTTLTLTIPANVTLFGDGPGASIIKLAAASSETLTTIATDLLVPTSCNPIIVPSQTGGPHYGITIRDIKVDGNTANQTGMTTADGDSYAGIWTMNSVGMVIDNVAISDIASTVNILGATTPRRGFCLFVNGTTSSIAIDTDATWTDASLTITDAGFSSVTAGMRARFLTGGTVGQDFYVASATSTTVVMVADINGSTGNIVAGGLTGKIYSETPTAGCSFYTKVSNCYFDNGGYDCVSVRGVGTRGAEITNCTILRGKQSSLQIYDRAIGTHVSNCNIDNRGLPDKVIISTAATWTNATLTITETGKFGNVTTGMRCAFSAGTGVTAGTDFNVVSATADTLVLSTDINGAGGDIVAGSIIGRVYNVGGGVLLHASRGSKLSGCTVQCDSEGAAVNVFGDNTAGYSEVQPNNCEDFSATNCQFTYSGWTSGIAAADFNGAGAGYVYSVRPSFANCGFSVSVPPSTNNACAIVGSGMVYGLLFNGCNFLSNSNEACINLGQSKDIVVNACTIRNVYLGSFNAASCYLVSAGDPGGPQGYVLSNSILYYDDIDSTPVSISNSNGVNITNNSIFYTNATQATGTSCLLNDADNTVVSGNLFSTGTTGSVFDVDNSGGTPDNITIANNTVMRGRTNTTQPTRGISCDNTATKVHILENDFSKCVTSSFGATFSPSTGSVVRGNKANGTQGITENKLTGALAAGAATVNHNLTAWRTLTPGDVVVQSNGSAIRCTAVSSTQITLAGTGTDTYYVTIRANEF